MDDTFGGDNFNSTAGPSAEATSEKKAEGVCPVFIKQILQAGEGNFEMFGMAFAMVTTVAIVRNIETSSTKITYTLEDHSGRIDAHYWLEDGDTIKSPDVMVNNYARVFASIRQHSGTKTLMVFKLVTVNDINELTNHMLEVLNARYKTEEFSKKGYNDNTNEFNGGALNNANAFGSEANNGLDSKHSAVLDVIRNYTDADGISRNELEKRFRHVNKNEITSMLDFMINEGHIYTTIDADHFQAV
ncbi:replication protein A 32 kDa subunit [Condylostylus longicornis]|uniref:replication protein A 32 kDa subunit n=1 Tax=Condylostylus longicornis TaxID=2530218 RepID=UPI00244E479D|nr:replication protein A 32 kDa subunit [Condylostylus longicornis]